MLPLGSTSNELFDVPVEYDYHYEREKWQQVEHRSEIVACAFRKSGPVEQFTQGQVTETSNGCATRAFACYKNMWAQDFCAEFVEGINKDDSIQNKLEGLMSEFVYR